MIVTTALLNLPRLPPLQMIVVLLVFVLDSLLRMLWLIADRAL